MSRRIATPTLVIWSIALLFLAVAITGCSSASSKAVTPESLYGSWATEEGSSPSISADIQDGDITMHFQNEDTKALYWSGTFNSMTSASDGKNAIVSTGYTDRMEVSLMGSGDSTKKFTYENGNLSFELTVMGMTQTIKLSRT